jgi:integrase
MGSLSIDRRRKARQVIVGILALLGRWQPLGDVSQWLGHGDVTTTYAVYRHMLPEAPVNAVSVLDADIKPGQSEGA